MKLTTIQCAPVIDNVLDDGTALTQLPYPYHLDEEGFVHGLMRLKISNLIGFQENVREQRVDLHWFSIQLGTHKIEDAIGMYPVFVGVDGDMFSLISAVDEIRTQEFTTEQLEMLDS